ncbi:hypothetical protein P22_2868 [Propionispora sp. 2/2-37]|uniref:cache domain-containing sensor histidine kinase n=1 Tax=Propionispora sp. 2/2-37 TaxID=1677858 RepID=UPI0006C473DB|nr:sensor histidine kinase [Propionispora sp. 2/2-37]CUH96757.1 hypothetical protein P22_2868 [Propionispora sp. 2/2-37]
MSRFFTGNRTVFRMVQKFRNLKIRSRLVLLFIVLALIPCVVSVFLAYKNSRDAIENKISTYSVQVMNQVSQNMRRELDRLQNDSVEIAFSDVVQQTLADFDRLSEWEVEKTKYVMRDNLAKKFFYLHDVTDVLIYTREKHKISAYGDIGFSLNLRQDYLKDYLQLLHDAGGGVVWSPVNSANEYYLVKYATSAERLNRSNGLLLGRAIKSLTEGNILGYLIIRINESHLTNIYKDTDIGSDADIFVIDANGLVISSRSPRVPVSTVFPDAAMVNKIGSWEKTGQHVFPYKLDGKEYLISFAPIEGVNWYVVSTIPYAYLNSDSEKILMGAIFISTSCFILAVFLSYFFAATILAPLRRLRKAMYQAQQGNLSISVNDTYSDEIGEVTQHFDNMLNEINHLMDNVKHKENQKRRAELKALQAQINPHFLSNTLNIVKFLAKNQGAHNIEEIVTSLIQLFHVAVGKGDDLITVREEIEYVQNYINIQEYRYLNKFQFHFEMEPDILDCLLPRLLLQPIVENALIHGIGPMEGQGMVVVKGFLYDQSIKFMVTDNGVGIPEEKLKTLLAENSGAGRRQGGIGISNVNERIKMYFGAPFGVTLESVPDLYTTVEITLPVVRKGETFPRGTLNAGD